MILNLSSNSLFFTVALYLLMLSTCYGLPSNELLKNAMTQSTKPSHLFSDLEKQIAAKIALDIRYFCATKPKQGNCLQPVTQLPGAIAEMITKTGVGSIVLFAENLVSTKQIIQLTHDLQQAAIKSELSLPLIISIDQEGGRVVRLPQATSFAGNMAIGATYRNHGVIFATDTSTVIAKELKLLGINNNYAPVVDVNTNADNPVINTRSFGENPQQVAALGVAAVNGFQQQGIMATLKHFPGHGDTHVDSHLGLPLVAHDLDTIAKKDIAPFQLAIDQSSPAMIMTAHIQYPALDDSTIENNIGEYIMRPATMSRKILTDLLRKKMGFDGIIATDALDMAGIAHYFDEVTAVVETFVAGADLAVMPFKIRSSQDIDKFYAFIKSVAKTLKQQAKKNVDKNKKTNDFSLAEITQSVTRINRYKAKYIQPTTLAITDQIALAEEQIAQPNHLKLEQSLADNAVVILNNKQKKLPIDYINVARIHLFVLNWQEFGALKQAITDLWQSLGKLAPQISATVIADADAQAQIYQGKKLAKADLLIATIDTKIASLVDIGGAEDIDSQKYSLNKQDKVSYQQLLSQQLKQAKQKNVPSVLVAKGSPYLLHPYRDQTDIIIATFDDRIYEVDDTVSYSPGYQTSIAIIFGTQQLRGSLPVNLPFN